MQGDHDPFINPQETVGVKFRPATRAGRAPSEISAHSSAQALTADIVSFQSSGLGIISTYLLLEKLIKSVADYALCHRELSDSQGSPGWRIAHSRPPVTYGFL